MNILLRLEGFCYAIAALLLYLQQGFSWVLVAVLSLMPDLSMIGYLAGPRIGAISYNIFHATPLPWVLLLAAHLSGNTVILSIALIWFAHIGTDRALGYGLKYVSSFKDTHLGRIGRE
jgi:hypothetical protein